ncbi:hypothetical protein [Hydrogenophaga atypica]|uniref:Uncharacterized protein n=1 Tax=Hydrogenophaga atypica TaxID=249409 RepID=A0ABW2QTU4_9BURK
MQLVGEGGGYIIEGVCTSAGWRFRRRVNDSFAAMLEDKMIINDTGQWLPSLDDALGLMDAVWPMLYPIVVHPNFVPPIRHRVLNFLRDKSNFKFVNSRRGIVVERWEEVGVDLSG